jgi:hypothetical protein
VLTALGRGLRDEFPNPDRIGCPGHEIVAAIAAQRMPLSQAEPFLDHLTSCSPCYRDFLGLQAKYRQRRTRMIFALAASVLIVVGLATWVTLRRDNNAQIARAVVDLRDRSAARGTEPHSNEMPIEIFRNVLNLEVYLPLGSSEGPYELRVVTDEGQIVSSTAGIAKVKSGITSLRLSVNISSARPGPYTLQLRKVGSDWSSYPLQIR